MSRLPLALPTILAGVKTSAVINVGTATIAAFIGAGGFGERIVAGPRAQRPRGAARRRAAGGGAGAAVHVLFELAERSLIRVPLSNR